MCDRNESVLLTNDGDSSDEEDAVTRLIDGINLSELNRGTTFQIRPDGDDGAFNDGNRSYFSNEEMLKHVRLENLDVGSDEEEGGPCVPGDTPFEKYAVKMKDITDDGGVKKKVVQQGDRNGPKVPEGALVTIHYNVYNEFIEEPFDSTYLRSGPQRFRLGSQAIVPGLEIAIRSMCCNERSWFLVKPHLAWGKLGCPPRILPDATVLFDVHILDFIDSGGTASFDALTSEEQSNAEFIVVLRAAKGLHLQGNDLFKSKNYRQAVKRYRRAFNILENCTTVKDQKDEDDLNCLLLKLYVNLGVTYNLMNDAPKVCTFTKKALALDPNNGKALYNRGKALLTLNEFSEARRFLRAAKRINPDCREINSELKKLDERETLYMRQEQELYQRMLSNTSTENHSTNPNKEKVKRAAVSDAFRETAMQDLKEFVEDERKEPLTFPQGLTAAEVDFTLRTAETLGLRVSISSTGKINIFKKD